MCAFLERECCGYLNRSHANTPFPISGAETPGRQRRRSLSAMPTSESAPLSQRQLEGHQERPHRLAQTRCLPALVQSPEPLDFTSDVIVESDTVGFEQSSDVSKGIFLKLGVEVAVKRLRIVIRDSDASKRKLAREMFIWSELCHQNVLPFLGYTVEGNHPALVSEWMKKGNLHGYMKTLKTQDSFSMLVGIARGLQYLHSNRVIHSDLRTANVLLSPEGTPLLADVGISKLEASLFTTLAGPIAESVWRSLRWLACEFFEFDDNDDDVNSTRRLEHNEKTDVWAFGMTIYELLTGDVPYAKIKSDLKVMSAIANYSLPPEPTFKGSPSDVALRRYMWSVCRQCWVTKPADRPSMGMLLKEVEEYLKLI